MRIDVRGKYHGVWNFFKDWSKDCAKCQINSTNSSRFSTPPKKENQAVGGFRNVLDLEEAKIQLSQNFACL